MTTAAKRESGFTIVELLVGIFILSTVSLGFYQVMLASTRGSETARSVVRISEEARLGLNRMVRDTREADFIAAEPQPTATSFTVKINFNGDKTADGTDIYQNPNAQGDYEILTFSYDATAKTIGLNGEVLMRGVEQVDGKDVFSYSSNFLEYDSNGDGVTSWQELDVAPGVVGNGNGVFDIGETPYLSNVTFAFRVRSADRVSEFYAEVQLRNMR